MPKVVERKVGRVFLREVSPGKWRGSWTCPLTLKHVRRILPAASFKDAAEQAEEITKELAAGRGFTPQLRGVSGHIIRDAMLEAIRHTNANDETRQQYGTRSNALQSYLRAHLPGVVAWGQLTPEIIENFVEHTRGQGAAWDTARQRLFVVRLASKFMARTYGYPDVAAGVKLRKSAPTNAELEAGETILSPSLIRSLVSFLREREPMLYALGMAQGFLGLRMQEALFLTEDDLDFEKRTLRVAPNSVHKPKNAPSHRLIPMPDCVAGALSDWIASKPVRPTGEKFLFTQDAGRKHPLAAQSAAVRAGVHRADRVSAVWGQAVQRARAEGLAIPKGFTARKLRGSFVTALRIAGLDSEILGAFIGHKPMTILTAHYDRITVERLRPIAKLAQEMFEGVGAFSEGSENGLKNVADLH